MVINMRPYWSGLISRGVLNIPASYTSGSVNLTQGSQTVTGTSTSWPVSDVVNTTINTTISNTGYNIVTPTSMANITNDSLLYVDAGGSPEVVPVLFTTPTTFGANFQFTHTTGFTATQSSLAYRQLRIGYQYPIYTVTAIVNSGELLLDQPWAGVALTTTSYSIQQLYYTFATNLKDFISVVDPQNGYTLQLHYPRAQLDFFDPQRSATDWPQYVSDYSRNLNGNFQWELYPSPTSQRQLYFTYIAEWPDMVGRDDRPPAFIDPSILVAGALADAWKVRLAGENPNGNLQTSQTWEQRFMVTASNAAQADNGKASQAYTWALGGGMTPGGANFWQSHDPWVQSGYYGG